MTKEQFCSEGCRKFMKIIETSTENFDTETAAVGMALKGIAEDFGIGRAEYQARQLHGTPKQLSENARSAVIFDSGTGVTSDRISTTYISRGMDEVTMTICKRSSAEWNQDDRENIVFISNLMATAFDRARMSELLINAKIIDSMTHILNTEGIFMKGTRLIRTYRPSGYTAFYFNLTNFKYVNKAVEYSAGDRVLTIYAEKLTAQINNEREAVGRLGGDNFAALIENDNVPRFLHFVNKVNIEIDNNGEYHSFVFGATIGAYKLDDDIRDMGRVMMGISTAYQIAKEIAHQPIIYCTPEMFSNFVRGKEVLMKFPEALAKREFLVYYQPKVDIRTDELTGAEALVRWKAGSEIVSPADFLPMLERNGEICRLDFYVFDVVCKNMKRWIDEGRKIPVVSSNFSRWHLSNNDFVEMIIGIADRYKIPHDRLEVEVTETTNESEYNTLLQAVKKLKANGIAVSIDDFGTGYSSLNMLKEIPVDVLKLDKSLLDQKNDPDKLHANDKIMLKHIVSLAEDMSIKVLAEGVETVEQREFLKSIGCNTVQGFLYDRPMPVEEFEKRINAGKYYI